MARSDQSGTPRETAAKAPSRAATEAFGILGNETRLNILLALWEAADPFAEDNEVPFSELKERVGVADSGQFNYHLQKLDGQYVESTADGYQLRTAGRKILRAVIAGAWIDEPTLASTEIDVACKLCGGPTVVTYEDEMLYHVCTECEGAFAETGKRPKGMLSAIEIGPPALANRAPKVVFAVAQLRFKQALSSMVERVCPRCFGEVKVSFDICDDHDTASGSMCSTCGRSYAIQVRFRCSVCTKHLATRPGSVIAVHPAVVAFYYERGLALGWHNTDPSSLARVVQVTADHEVELVEGDPPLVRVTIPYEGDELRLTFDENLIVSDVSEND